MVMTEIDGNPDDMAGVWDGALLNTTGSFVLTEHEDVQRYAPYLGGKPGALAQFYRAMLLDVRKTRQLIMDMAHDDGVAPDLLTDEDLDGEVLARVSRDVRRASRPRKTRVSTTTREDVRECIADRLEIQAEWREVKPEEHSDHRSKDATEAMRACALYVRELPADDERLVYLDSVSTGISPFMFEFADDVVDENQLLWGRIGLFACMGPSEHLDQIVAFYQG
jgi:hypothetical protein